MKDGFETNSLNARISKTLRDIPDFPSPGVVFKDITPVLSDGALFCDIIEHLKERYQDHQLDTIVGIESRGFIFGAALAHALGVGMTLIRKPGKLPYDTVGIDYALEYGTDRLEMHTDSIFPGQKVVVIDDVLATGGTCAAAVDLLNKQDAEIVECAFFIELSFLNGKDRLGGHPLYSMLKF